MTVQKRMNETIRCKNGVLAYVQVYDLETLYNLIHKKHKETPTWLQLVKTSAHWFKDKFSKKKKEREHVQLDITN